MRAVGYLRVSTDDQADKGASLDWQKTAIAQECARQGWQLADLATDTASARNMTKRPGLRAALEQLEHGTYQALVVARLDRLTRHVPDFYELAGRADKQGWLLVCMEPRFDMTNPFSRMAAGVAVVFAQFERELISQRTRDGIEAKKAAGTYRGGHALPHSQPISGATAARIVALSAEGCSAREVARRLELEGVPTARGGRWDHATVRKVLARAAAAPEV